MAFPKLVFMSFVLIVGLMNSVRGLCDGRTGPPGGVDCITIGRYNKKQWGTCLTDVYIRQKSGNQHQCEDRSRTYCYYQCMIELYDVNSGNVNSVCACNDSVITTTQRGPTTASLPAECLSPDGSSCSWYKDCLERKYPCQGTSADYALEYATKFCNLYTDRKAKFSPIGQRWIDAVRKCLQVALVPLIRPFANVNCTVIRDEAFASHTPCYLQPFQGEPSICDLPKRDWLRTFWTIKSAFIASKPIAYASLQGALDTFKSCKIDPAIDTLQHFYQQFQLIIDLIHINWNSQVPLLKNELDEIAAGITDKISEILKIGSVQWGFYGYATTLSKRSGSNGYQQMVIELLIADMSSIDNDTLVPSYNVSNPQLETTIKKFENALIDGDLEIKNEKGTFYVSESSHCADMDCKVTSEQISAPVYVPKNNANYNSRSFYSIVFVLFSILIFL